MSMRLTGSTNPKVADPSQQRGIAISRWDNEGGSPCRPQPGRKSVVSNSDVPDLANAELVQLHARVIALENLVLTLLADASDRQLARASEMAAYISPRPGFTRHPATIRAASLMVRLVERARRFQFTMS